MMLRNKLTPKSLTSWGTGNLLGKQSLRRHQDPTDAGILSRLKNSKKERPSMLGRQKPQRPVQENSWIGAVSTGLS